MKKHLLPFISLLLLLIVTVACTKDEDNPNPPNLEVQDFIWEGMNLYYLWKDNIPNLSNSVINDPEGYVAMLAAYEDPADFFESLIYNRQTVDKWSWIVDDYIALENSFQGIGLSNGVEYGLFYETGSTTDVFGYVRYILPNTDAASKNVQRGQIFDAINGTQLTVSNYRELLNQEVYTMNFADLNGGNPVSNGQSVELIKSEYQENPIFKVEVFEYDGIRIGYLLYNAFTSSFDKQLNDAFAYLKSENISELVLDLRYNSGGSVATATYLASMITGQFTGLLFTKEKWNNDLQEWFESNQPDWLVNNFTDQLIKVDEDNNVVVNEPINSLFLSRLFVITTGSSASASELIINGLNPYINVTTIGTKTSGKYTASVTLYDSDTFGRTGANLNPNHTWAMQPIVLEEINAIGQNDKDGFDPTIEFPENLNSLGVLGTTSEPLLARAIDAIINGGKSSSSKSYQYFNEFKGSKDLQLIGNQMYVDKSMPLQRKNVAKNEAQ